MLRNLGYILEVLLLFEQNAGALFYVSEPIKGIILLTLQHQYN